MTSKHKVSYALLVLFSKVEANSKVSILVFYLILMVFKITVQLSVSGLDIKRFLAIFLWETVYVILSSA